MATLPIEGAAALSTEISQRRSDVPSIRTSMGEEVDIIRLIQERDAYKLETDKLRKIIDRQRFIIQSLQEQISRKPSASATSTPVVQSPEVPLESPNHHSPLGNPSIDSTAVAAVPGGGALDGSKKDAMSPVDEGSNSLGLSALSTTAQPKSSPAIRKISQGSATASPLLQSESNITTTESPTNQPNARPWVKSTRLSEIYADYSARHNSVSPMFRSSAGSSPAVAGSAGIGDNRKQRVSSSGGSSFVDSLKTSMQRTGWPEDWLPVEGHDYDNDTGLERQLSESLVFDTSRDPSLSIDPVDTKSPDTSAQHTHGSSGWSPRSVADGLDVDLALNSSMPVEAIEGATHIVKQSSDLSTKSVGKVSQTSTSDIPGPSATNDVSALSVTVPTEAAQPRVAVISPAQKAQELLVLRPISTLANRVDQMHLDRAIRGRDSALQRDDGWRVSQISQYEYGELSDKQPVQVPTESILSHQHSQSAYALGPSFRAASSTQQNVKWALGKEASTASARLELGMSGISDSQTASGSGSQGAKTRRKISETTITSAKNDTSLLSAYSDGEPSIHNEPGAAAVPQSLTPLHSYASTSRQHPPLDSQLSSLQDIDIWIKDSRVKIDERGKEVNVYLVDIVRRKEISGMSLQEILIESQQSSIVMWTVEKRYSDFLNLNTKLRQVISKERLADKLEKLPEKDMFRPNAPTKSDKRKLWFEKYLKKALMLPITDKQPLVEFLSTNHTVEPEKNMPILLGHKEGFLVKKGKNFGGWKRRYYVCKSNKPVLEYFESPGGSVIGSINLSGAVVKMGKTRDNEIPTSRSKAGQKTTDMFRHAFLIEEKPKRSGRVPVSHPLWADSDRERDEWVMALRYVIVLDSDGPERAMKDIVKYLNYTNNKDPNMLMLHQIHTSIAHEQGARRSIEYSRLKEEQRISAASVDSSDGRNLEMRKPCNPPNTQPSGSVGSSTNYKFGSPLSRQMWPVTASMDNLGYGGRGGGDVSASAVGADANAVGAGSSQPLDMSGSRPDHLDQRTLQEKNRHRSLSYPASPVGEQELPDSQRREAGFKSRPSPAVIAATLSTSFSGFNDDSLSSQADRLSIHYVPSEISTIESSIYSSYNGVENSQRVNGVSSQSVDEQNSYASMPESPVSPHRPTEAEPVLAGRTRDNNPNNPASVQREKASKDHRVLVHADSTPQLQTHGASIVSPNAFGDTGTQVSPAVPGAARIQFTKNSLGRIVHEEEYVPELTSDTPNVTDDILGVGRQEPPTSSAVRDGGDGRTRTREEKKRGRITFMWGKRKPAEVEPALPDSPFLASGSGGPSRAANGSGADASPPVSAPRRLRRGSMHGDNRHASGKSNALKESIFGLPLELAVKLSKVKEHYHLPAVVYRCIEYLDAKKAWLEEGIYRQSGSSLALSTLRKEFNNSSDYNLLKLSKPPDIHAVASLLKAYLRELPESVLTLRLHQDFMRVVDLADRGDRVHELGRLVSELPIANYTLLRALTAHLIRIVQKASMNRMTLRNIGIVFSPSLGIPVSVFSLLMIEFEYIFWVNDSGVPEPKSLSADASSAAGNSASTPQGQHDPQLSVSVPSGMNKTQDEETPYSAGSQPGADSASLGSDVPIPLRMVDERRSATALRAGAPMRPGISNQRSQDAIPGTAAASAAASNLTWDSQVENMLISAPGSAVGDDYSRYPGISSNAQDKKLQQQRAGRSNRNSIQYKVGAPRELISQEVEMTMPSVFNESDDFDDSEEGVNSDDFNGGSAEVKTTTSRNNSNLIPQFVTSRNASYQH
ncbi:Rho GTPase activating protein [Coemansia sp. RSA 1285]|nr:Rho GTPase activating protein [Coemansia sp. RSA 1285]